jgi:hypothetical protein
VAEFPIVFEDRRVGQSKMSSKIVLEAFSYVTRMAVCEGRLHGARAVKSEVA